MQDLDDEGRVDHLVGFLMSHNGELHISRAWLSSSEAWSLLRLLSGLAEVGLIILPKVLATPLEEGPAAVRAVVAAYATEPLIAAVEAVQAGHAFRLDQPSAVMPVWPFAPDPGQPEVLLGSGQLWGVDVYLEALPVEDDDLPVPKASVVGRFEAWRRAVGGDRPPATLRLPGRGDAYVLFASTGAVADADDEAPPLPGRGFIASEVEVMTPNHPESFIDLVRRYAPATTDDSHVRRTSLRTALDGGEDPLQRLQYLAGLGLVIRTLPDLLAINDLENEEELSAFKVQEGVAVSAASDGVWVLFSL